jgi:hypothetical protein
MQSDFKLVERRALHTSDTKNQASRWAKPDLRPKT